MTLFVNGYRFPVAISLTPTAGQKVPFIQAEMAGQSGVLMPVVGKLDTGAFTTMLTFATAGALGIRDPQSGFIRRGDAQVANGGHVTYYVHRVSVNVPNDSGPSLGFVLNAGFAEKLPVNLFGMDWMQHLCAAVDRERVHLLRT